MPHSVPLSIATHLPLPSWWVSAYEAASVAPADGGVGPSAMALAAAAGIAPALSAHELNALAVVVAGLQEQLLAGAGVAGRPLVVSSEEHLKHASTAAKSRRFLFEKLMQLLPGLRLLRAKGDGGLRSHKLFSRDVWTRQGEAFCIELTPARLGPELLLGFADAHLDLLRLARGETQGSALLDGLPPLDVWRSIWLDLQGAEQALFLRMERSMQWDFRWLQLEGVFGMPLAALFAGLESTAVTAAGGGGDGDGGGGREALQRRLRLVSRLGSKLCSHGFLSTAVDGQFLALDGSADGGLHLVWQVARERLASEAAAKYRAAVTTYMLRLRLAPERDSLLRAFLPEATTGEAMQDARALWERIMAVPTTAAPLGGAGYAPCQTLLPQVLFLEFCLRRRYGGAFPLPQLVLTGPLAELTVPFGATGDGPAADAEVGARFARFLAYLEDSPDFVTMLASVPFASLSSDASKAEPTLKAYLRAILRSASPLGGLGAADGVKPRLIAPATSEAAAAAAGAAAAKAPAAVGGDDDEAQGEGPGGPRRGAVSGALASRMRRIAGDELQQMRAGHPERYVDLKKIYLNSLDEVGRRLFLDVQKRMQPTMFEENLRQRLVRFMVENPGAWRSSEPRAPGFDSPAGSSFRP